MKPGPMHPKLADELKKARIQFSKTAAKDERAALLTLVDPIRAFADAGVALSPQARKYIRHTYPGFAYGDRELFERVRDGKTRLPWIRRVRVRLDQAATPKEG